MIVKLCLNCNNEFKVFNHREHSAKYCSLKCKLDYKSIIKECSYCKKRFKVPTCDERLKCCSMECSKLWRKGITPWNKGKINCYSKETLEIMRQKKKGKITWITGKKHSAITIKKLKDIKFKNPVRYWKNKRLPNHVVQLMKERNKGKWLKEKNPNWANGKSWEEYPQEFNKEFKLKIGIRDGFKCLKCGIIEIDSIKLFKRKLHIHHINYNKSTNILENCCCLCVRCNAESNRKREQCTIFFQNLLSKMYGYVYPTTDINVHKQYIDKAYPRKVETKVEYKEKIVETPVQVFVDQNGTPIDTAFNPFANSKFD